MVKRMILRAAGLAAVTGLAPGRRPRSSPTQLAYGTLYEQGIARYLATFKTYPPKRIVGMAAE